MLNLLLKLLFFILKPFYFLFEYLSSEVFEQLKLAHEKAILYANVE